MKKGLATEKSKSNTANTNILIAVFLTLVIILLYFQMHNFGFISFDDPLYVANNPQVHKGLTIDSISWAFSLSKQGEVTNWHPLTWMSHMLDYQLFGLDAGWHHLMSVFLHIISTVLLFIALRLLTGSVWKSAFVASLFALHPVNVDSVAWIAERKNVLSTVFWMLTMIAYYYYCRKPGILMYCMMAISICLGSLAKQMLMTLPFVLLLFDYWPMGRVKFPEIGAGREEKLQFYKQSWRLVIEKIPLIIMSFIFFFSTMLSLKYSRTIQASSLVTMDLKIKNAIVSYVLYIWKMVWPIELSVFHPYPDAVPMWQVAGSIVIILLITVLTAIRFRKNPYLIVGWLWFLGTLVPVLGLIQAGLWPAIGERWAYIPYIGLFIIAAWGVPDLLSRIERKREIMAAAAAVVLLLLAVRTWHQIGYWKDDYALFNRAIAIDPDNYMAHVNIAAVYAQNNDVARAEYHFEEALRVHATDTVAIDGLARLYSKSGQYDKSIRYYLEELRLNSDDVKANFELGMVYSAKGDNEKAVGQFRKTIELDPNHAEAYYNLGVVSAKKGELGSAAGYLSAALKIDPDDAVSHCTIGVVLMNQGKVNEALSHFREALRLDPNNEEARKYMEAALKYSDKVDEDIERYEKILQNKPDDAGALQKLAVLYSFRGDNAKALDMLMKLVRIRPADTDAYYNVACVYAKTGRTGDSVEWLKKAIDKGFKNFGLLSKDKDLENIRNTPFYIELMKKQSGRGS